MRNLICIAALWLTPAGSLAQDQGIGVWFDAGQFRTSLSLISPIPKGNYSLSFKNSGYGVGMALLRDQKTRAAAGFVSYTTRFSSVNSATQEVDIDGTARVMGIIISDHVHIWSRYRLNAGLSFGGGVGWLSLDYKQGTNERSADAWVPLLESLIRAGLDLNGNTTIAAIAGLRGLSPLFGVGIRTRIK